jgi:hypothetical protein
MTVKVLSDALVVVNAVDLSDHVESVEINDSVNLQEANAMGQTGSRRLAGLRDWEATITFFQDYDAAKVDATLQPLIGVQTAIRVRESATSAIGATNPEYQGNGMLESLPAVAGAVDGVHKLSVTFRCSDGVALVRATS